VFRRIQHLQTLLHNERNARDSTELAGATCNAAYGPLCVPESKATYTSKNLPETGETKLDEEGYEELPSCTLEQDEHTYQDVTNAKGN
jgi:hypothetical protein